MYLSSHPTSSSLELWGWLLPLTLERLGPTRWVINGTRGSRLYLLVRVRQAWIIEIVQRNTPTVCWYVLLKYCAKKKRMTLFQDSLSKKRVTPARRESLVKHAWNDAGSLSTFISWKSLFLLRDTISRFDRDSHLCPREMSSSCVHHLTARVFSFLSLDTCMFKLLICALVV